MMKRPGHVPRELWPDGHLANTFVGCYVPQYAKIKAIIESGEVPAVSASPHGSPTMRECVRAVQAGVWVPHLWLR